MLLIIYILGYLFSGLMISFCIFVVDYTLNQDNYYGFLDYTDSEFTLGDLATIVVFWPFLLLIFLIEWIVESFKN